MAAPLTSTALRLPPVPGPDGVPQRVALDDRDDVDVHAELVRHHLGNGRLDALAVAGAAHERLHFTVDPDADDGRFAGQAAHGDAGRLYVQPEPDAEQAPSPRAAACSMRNAS